MYHVSALLCTSLYRGPDQLTYARLTDHLGTLFLWGEVEEWLLIICMCIPPTWPLFKPYFERFLETTSRSRNRSTNSNARHPPTIGSQRCRPNPDVEMMDSKFDRKSPETTLETTLEGPIGQTNSTFYFDSEDDEVRQGLKR